MLSTEPSIPRPALLICLLQIFRFPAIQPRQTGPNSRRRPTYASIIRGMRFEVVTIFPAFFSGFLENGIVRRALGENLVGVGVHDLRASRMTAIAP